MLVFFLMSVILQPVNKYNIQHFIGIFGFNLSVAFIFQYLNAVCKKKLFSVLFSCNSRNISMISSIERPEFRWTGGGLALLFETTAVICMMPRFLQLTYN